MIVWLWGCSKFDGWGGELGELYNDSFFLVCLFACRQWVGVVVFVDF